MIDYYNGADSFSEFVKYVLEAMEEENMNDKLANIVVADSDIYESYIDNFVPSWTIGQINKLDKVNVTLIESLSELQLLINCHLQTEASDGLPNLPAISRNTRVIGFYGVFDHFLKEGEILMENRRKEKNIQDYTENSNSGFMSLKDYSAKTINHLCYLIHSMCFFKKYRAIISEPQDINVTSTLRYIPPIWNRMIPNLQPDETEDSLDVLPPEGSVIYTSVNHTDASSIDLSAIEDEEIPKSIRRTRRLTTTVTQLGLVLSKWASII